MKTEQDKEIEKLRNKVNTIQNKVQKLEDIIYWGKLGICKGCEFVQHTTIWGPICKHRTSLEGIEAEKDFYECSEIVFACPYHSKK